MRILTKSYNITMFLIMGSGLFGVKIANMAAMRVALIPGLAYMKYAV